jgi:hypothetical protein
MKSSAHAALAGVAMIAAGVGAVSTEHYLLAPLGCVVVALGILWLAGAFCAWRLGE